MFIHLFFSLSILLLRILFISFFVCFIVCKKKMGICNWLESLPLFYIFRLSYLNHVDLCSPMILSAFGGSFLFIILGTLVCKYLELRIDYKWCCSSVCCSCWLKKKTSSDCVFVLVSLFSLLKFVSITMRFFSHVLSKELHSYFIGSRLFFCAKLDFNCSILFWHQS